MDTLKPIDMATLRPFEEADRLGQAIYERDIRPLVEADHQGECVAIDLDSGCWAISDDELEATELLRADRPDANDVWMIRVGSRAVFHIGGSPLQSTE